MRQSKIRAFVIIILVASTVTGCCISHEWKDATCEAPKTCAKCGKTEGEALGHKWEPATCTTPKTCVICGKTEGDKLGHKAGEWEIKKIDGEKKEVQYCKRCGEKMNEKNYEIPYFDISYTDLMNQYNREHASMGLQIRKTEAGFLLYLNDNDIGIVFNKNMNKEKGLSSYSTEENEKFNKITLRCILSETELDYKMLDRILVMGMDMVSVLINEEDYHKAASLFYDHMSVINDSSDSFKAQCIINGRKIIVSATFINDYNPRYFYEFTCEVKD